MTQIGQKEAAIGDARKAASRIIVTPDRPQ
jgi:hypothetical protein